MNPRYELSEPASSSAASGWRSRASSKAGVRSWTRWFTCLSLRSESACRFPSRPTRCSSRSSSTDCPGKSSRATASPLASRGAIRLANITGPGPEEPASSAPGRSRRRRHEMVSCEMHRLFVVCAPGLEKVLSGEMGAPATAGGVEIESDLREAARLNLTLRTATRVLLRLGELRATTFAELVKKAQKLPFDLCLRKGDPVALRVACHKSRLYHSGAVAERLREAIGERLGQAPPEAGAHQKEGEPPQMLLAPLHRGGCTGGPGNSGP